MIAPIDRQARSAFSRATLGFSFRSSAARASPSNRISTAPIVSLHERGAILGGQAAVGFDGSGLWTNPGEGGDTYGVFDVVMSSTRHSSWTPELGVRGLAVALGESFFHTHLISIEAERGGIADARPKHVFTACGEVAKRATARLRIQSQHEFRCRRLIDMCDDLQSYQIRVVPFHKRR